MYVCVCVWGGGTETLNTCPYTSGSGVTFYIDVIFSFTENRYFWLQGSLSNICRHVCPEARPANKQSKHTWTHTRVTWLRVIVTSSSRSRAIIMEATARMKSPAIATCNNRQHERLDTVRKIVTSELLEHRLCTTKFHMLTQRIHVFCVDLRTNSDYFTVQHWLTGWFLWPRRSVFIARYVLHSTFCPHIVFMCFVWIWEQRAIIALYSID